MHKDVINILNFDKVFDPILFNKKGNNVVYGRLVFDELSLSNRINFLVDNITLTNGITGIVYKLLFWEDDINIINSFKMFDIQERELHLHKSYINTDIPGEIFYNEDFINTKLLQGLINLHFNFEHAIEPSFNARLLICLNRKNGIILFDIYDDRGCDVYFLCQ